MRPLVIVRPEPGASATASAAQQRGLKTIVMPLFAVEPVEWGAPGVAEFDGLLLTSANAIRHGGPQLGHLRDLPAHCVGTGTAAAARDGGFAIASAGTGGVDELLDSLPPELRLLHLCGTDRRAPRSPRQTIVAVPVYRSAELPPPPSLDNIEGTVVLLHSPRSASRLSSLADQAKLARESIAIAAISEKAAEAAGAGWEKIKAAGEPSDSALLALAASLCNNQ